MIHKDKKKNHLSIFTLSFPVVILLFVSCINSSDLLEDPPSSRSQATKNNQEKQKSKENSEERPTDIRLRFPKTSTRHQIKLILLTLPNPGTGKVTKCQNQVQKAAEEHQSQEELLVAKSKWADIVYDDYALYHFCFFRILEKLDLDLERGGGLYDHMAPLFVSTMRGLWLLAQGLDETGHTKRYFTFLRNRYVAISEETFGRNMAIIGPPMGNLPIKEQKDD